MNAAPDAVPPPATTDDGLLTAGRRALRIEATAVESLLKRLDARFAAACRLCLACTGRIVVTGMGKSGHVGGKIAATLASTGSPSFSCTRPKRATAISA